MSSDAEVVDLLGDAAKRLGAEATRLCKAKVKEKSDNTAKGLRNACKAPVGALASGSPQVAAFFLRWTCERLMSCPEKRQNRGRRRGTALQQAEQQAAAEEAKEASRALERQRAMALTELHGLVARGAMPWLWLSDPSSWQQVAGACSDGGFCALDSVEVCPRAVGERK